jgi:hypothetical protein
MSTVYDPDDDGICPDCGEADDWCTCYDEEEPCLACGTPGCPGYCDDYQTYNLRPAETGGDPHDEDGHQRYKDDLAMGRINPDGSQRDPDPPEEREPDWDPPAEDAGQEGPQALPEGETCDTEPPF